ncbi:BTB/POZ domain-containing protein [Drosera capensis]
MIGRPAKSLMHATVLRFIVRSLILTTMPLFFGFCILFMMGRVLIVGMGSGVRSAFELGCPEIVVSSVECLEAVPWEEAEVEEILRNIPPMGSFVDSILARLQPADPLAAGKIFLSAVRYTSLLESFSGELEEPDASGEKLESLKSYLSDLSWASRILSKLELVRDLVITWTETSKVLVNIVEQASSDVDILGLKVIEVSAKVLEAMGCGSVILLPVKRFQVVKKWLPFARFTKLMHDTALTSSGQEDGLTLRMDSEVWQSLESALVSVILALPSVDQVALLTECQVSFPLFLDLAMIIETCVSSKSVLHYGLTDSHVAMSSGFVVYWNSTQTRRPKSYKFLLALLMAALAVSDTVIARDVDDNSVHDSKNDDEKAGKSNHVAVKSHSGARRHRHKGENTGLEARIYGHEAAAKKTGNNADAKYPGDEDGYGGYPGDGYPVGGYPGGGYPVGGYPGVGYGVFPGVGYSGYPGGAYVGVPGNGYIGYPIVGGFSGYYPGAGGYNGFLGGGPNGYGGYPGARDGYGGYPAGGRGGYGRYPVPRSGYGGYPGGRGGYRVPGGYPGRGYGYCRFGCCGSDDYGCRCCSYPGEAVGKNVEKKPQH